MKKFDLQDVVLRALVVAAGTVAAAIFVLKGQGGALPPLAIGASLGAFFIMRLEQSAE